MAIQITSAVGYVEVTHASGEVDSFPKGTFSLKRRGNDFFFMPLESNKAPLAQFSYTGGSYGVVSTTAPVHSSADTLEDALQNMIAPSISGQTADGTSTAIPLTAEGHIEVAIHAPTLPFGSIHTESLTPIFQSDGVYGINPQQEVATSSGSGTATTLDSAFRVTTGTTALSQGIIQSRKRLRYRAGQGVVGRFTAVFTTPVTYSYQTAGFGHAEDGVYFGYREATGTGYSGVDPAFGILYVSRGVRETQTLTVTTGATSSENVTITLNSVAFTIAVTDSSNVQRTVWEISQGTYAGWSAYPEDDTVVFVNSAAGVTAGTYSFAAGTTGAAATIAQTKAGAASTETFIPQSTWNGDLLDGTGPSGYTLDPTTGNVYQIGIQYLGFGSITFQIEVTYEDRNNSEFITVHTIKYPNTETITSFGNPSFPFTTAVYSAGSTTDLTVDVGSFAGFIEGPMILHGPKFTYLNQLGTNVVGAGAFYALFTILNRRYFSGRSNQAVINIQSIFAALKHTSPCFIYVIKNGALVGNPDFQEIASNSCSLWDTAATTVTYSTGDQVLWSGQMGDTGHIAPQFTASNEDVTLQPGEYITVAAKTTTGNATYVTASVNTREDQ